jgi:Pentapeptide repeats (9 copies)
VPVLGNKDAGDDQPRNGTILTTPMDKCVIAARLGKLQPEGTNISGLEDIVHGTPVSQMRALCLFVVACFLASPCALAADYQSNKAHSFSPTDVETYVLNQVFSGQQANLCPANCQPEALNKSIRAACLEELLSGRIKPLMPGTGITIIGVRIDGPIHLHGMDIDNDVELQRCVFKDPVDFSGCHFHKALRLNQSVFGRFVEFNDAQFDGPVEAKGAHFMDGAYFKQIRSKSSVSFNANASGDMERTIFESEASFDDARVELNFEAQRALFKGDTEISGAKFASNLLLNGTEFEGRVWFNDSSVSNNFEVKGMKIKGSLEMRSASFGVLTISDDMKWPNSPDQISISGMTYGRISYAEKSGLEPWQQDPELETWNYLRARFAAFPFNVDNYERLAEFFRKQGRPELADDVFIEQKTQERKRVFWKGMLSRGGVLSRLENAIRWTWSWTLRLLVGYGRQPWLAIAACAVIIVIGCFVFSPHRMELQKPMDPPRVYNSFWYSLNLFLPVVDLQAKDVWKPKSQFVFARNYLRVHVLLGWILVPIILAALSGLIK